MKVNIKLELKDAVELAFILDDRINTIESEMSDLEVTGDPYDPTDYRRMKDLDREHSALCNISRDLHKDNKEIRDGMFDAIRQDLGIKSEVTK